MNSTKPEVNSKEVTKNDFGTSISLLSIREGCILPFNLAETVQAILYTGSDDKEAFYENSQPFSQFLQSQGLDDLLIKTGLKLRDKHHIIPHVCDFPLCWFASNLR